MHIEADWPWQFLGDKSSQRLDYELIQRREHTYTFPPFHMSSKTIYQDTILPKPISRPLERKGVWMSRNGEVDGLDRLHACVEIEPTREYRLRDFIYWNDCLFKATLRLPETRIPMF